MMVVLLGASEKEPSLQPAVMSELARVGVTSVSLVRGGRLLGLVIEGWAFDPSRSLGVVVAAVAGPGSRVRTLHPIAELAVSTVGLHDGGER